MQFVPGKEARVVFVAGFTEEVRFSGEGIIERGVGFDFVGRPVGGVEQCSAIPSILHNFRQSGNLPPCPTANLLNVMPYHYSTTQLLLICHDLNILFLAPINPETLHAQRRLDSATRPIVRLMIMIYHPSYPQKRKDTYRDELESRCRDDALNAAHGDLRLRERERALIFRHIGEWVSGFRH